MAIKFVFSLDTVKPRIHKRLGTQLPLIVLIVILFIPPIQITAETIDPLEQKLTQVTGKKKINILNELSYKYRKKFPEKCIALGEQALELARKFNDRTQEAEALVNIGAGYLYSCQEELAQKNFSLALAISKEKSVAIKKQFSFLTMVGKNYRQVGNPIKSLEFFENALQLARELGNAVYIACACNKLGAVYWDISEYDKALTFYLEAVEIFKAHDLKINFANTLNNIGMVYHKLGDTHKALQFYRKSLKIRKEINRKIDIAASYNNIGVLYTDLNDLPGALEYFLTSLEIREEIDDKEGIVKCLSNIGFIYNKSGKNRKALDVYQKALTLAEETGDERIIASPLLRISGYYIDIDAYDQAYPLLRRCLNITRKLQAKTEQMIIYSYLSKYYSSKGNYKKALEYSNLHFQLKETVFSEESRNKINELETKIKIEKKEKENQLLKKENQTRILRNRIQIIISIAVVLLLIAGLIITYKYYRYYKNETQRKEERQRRLELESKLKLFQAQLNPHFLFNSLDSIKESGYEQDPQKLEKLVYYLSDLYRKILYSSDALVVPLENEITILVDFLEIEKRMMKGLLDYHIDVDDQLKSFRIMPLSLETLVENSVIHGIAPRGKGTVTITIYKKNTLVLIEIIDDGVGFDIKTVKLGYGLFSIQERLKLYYQDKATFNINSSPGKGTRVMMELPYD
jgi:tetratricopeptide (TPR) repeat protein